MISVVIQEIVQKQTALEQALSDATAAYEANRKRLVKEIADCERLRQMAADGADIEKIRLAETVLYVRGRLEAERCSVCYRAVEDAIRMLAARGHGSLRNEYVGVKDYGSFHQREDHPYGYGPRHGRIVFEIGLRDRQRELTPEEVDACIHLLEQVKLGRYKRAV